MAVNQVSLFFYPPRWQQQVTTSTRGRTAAVTPIWIARAARAANDGPAVTGADLKAWLTEQGFTSVEWGKGNVFERGQVPSIFGPEKAIEVSVGEEAGEVTHLYCRFTLPRDMPPPLTEWSAFVVLLCRRFCLRLAPDGVEPCSETEFLTAVRANRNWQEFAHSFGWDAGGA
jgi:hypothetical protein